MVVGKSASKTAIRSLIFDDENRVREGVVVVKYVGKCGPYGYRVHWVRSERKHEWVYLGTAEPGLPTGTYSPDAPLKFYRGHAQVLEDKHLVLVGKWDSWRTSADVDTRLESAGYLPEVVD